MLISTSLPLFVKYPFSNSLALLINSMSLVLIVSGNFSTSCIFCARLSSSNIILITLPLLLISILSIYFVSSLMYNSPTASLGRSSLSGRGASFFFDSMLMELSLFQTWRRMVLVQTMDLH